MSRSICEKFEKEFRKFVIGCDIKAIKCDKKNYRKISSRTDFMNVDPISKPQVPRLQPKVYHCIFRAFDQKMAIFGDGYGQNHISRQRIRVELRKMFRWKAL